MTYVITSSCVDIKDMSCIEECPVDCIYEGERKLYVNPKECIDCGACEPVCPVEAITQDRRVADEDVSFRFQTTTTVDIPVADPTLNLEHTEFLEKFYGYLRQPVEEAASACLQAQTRGKAAAERARLDSLTQKLDRTLAVLTLMGEGYTQEETAAQLHLTRNQVKYIVEKVQEAYLRFTARHKGNTSASSGAGATHHV